MSIESITICIVIIIKIIISTLNLIVEFILDNKGVWLELKSQIFKEILYADENNFYISIICHVPCFTNTNKLLSLN